MTPGQQVDAIVSTAIADQAALSTIISVIAGQSTNPRETIEKLRRTTFNSVKGILDDQDTPEGVKAMIQSRLNLIFDLTLKA